MLYDVYVSLHLRSRLGYNSDIRFSQLPPHVAEPKECLVNFFFAASRFEVYTET